MKRRAIIGLGCLVAVSACDDARIVGENSLDAGVAGATTNPGNNGVAGSSGGGTSAVGGAPSAGGNAATASNNTAVGSANSGANTGSGGSTSTGSTSMGGATGSTSTGSTSTGSSTGSTSTGGTTGSTTTQASNGYECRTNSSGITGWHLNGNLVCAATCTDCIAKCQLIGSKSEGVYAQCPTTTTTRAGCNGSLTDLIEYASCGAGSSGTGGATGAGGATASTSTGGSAGSSSAAACVLGCRRDNPQPLCTANNKTTWICDNGADVMTMQQGGCTDAGTGANRYCCATSFQPLCQ